MNIDITAKHTNRIHKAHKDVWCPLDLLYCLFSAGLSTLSTRQSAILSAILSPLALSCLHLQCSVSNYIILSQTTMFCLHACHNDIHLPLCFYWSPNEHERSAKLHCPIAMLHCIFALHCQIALSDDIVKWHCLIFSHICGATYAGHYVGSVSIVVVIVKAVRRQQEIKPAPSHQQTDQRLGGHNGPAPVTHWTFVCISPQPFALQLSFYKPSTSMLYLFSFRIPDSFRPDFYPIICDV